jgi:fatty-acyl-CoA synthase
VTVPPARALALAGDTARAEGWTVLAQDLGFGDLGRLEATDATFLFGRLDDIVVRIVPHPAGSRVDVRSSARDDGEDGGRNADRIRRFLAYLAERAATEPAGTPAS